jgi:hypothetical protein
MKCVLFDWNQFRSVSVVTDYGLDGRGVIPSKDKDFSLPHHIQTGSGAHLASCLMNTKGSHPRGRSQDSSVIYRWATGWMIMVHF